MTTSAMTIAGWMRRAPVTAYVLLAYLFTWSIGLPLLATRRGWADLALSHYWEAVSAFGPLLAALLVARVAGGATQLRELLHSMRHWRVGTGWLLFSVLSPLVLLALAALLLRAASGDWPDFTMLTAGRLATALGLFELVVIAGLAQGLGEEPGWRGFMLPALRRRFTPLLATVVLFPAWLFWHLPAFLGRPEFGLAQWLGFSAGVLAAAVWLTYLWEKTRSVLMAIAWHVLINIARGVALAISMPMFLAFSTFVLAGAVVIVVGWWLGRHRRP